MNQFKKAKQKALQSGHQLENITDLQTAGITQPAEEQKPAEPQPTEQPVEAMIEPAQPIIQETAAPVPQPAIVSEPTILETPVIQESAPAPTQASIQVPITETAPIIKEIPITENPVIKEPEESIIITPEPEYEEVVVSEPVAAIPVQVPEPVPVPVRVAPTPVSQEVTYTAPVSTPTVTTSKPSTAKKNIPNIFAPKNEAKSMRKSLVLKPSSVKIAENYCAKNGGSFNELIQTLLDNFIDEYGL